MTFEVQLERGVDLKILLRRVLQIQTEHILIHSVEQVSTICCNDLVKEVSNHFWPFNVEDIHVVLIGVLLELQIRIELK